MNEAEESAMINQPKVKVGDQCIYSKTHTCNGKECKPYPCHYFIGDEPK